MTLRNYHQDLRNAENCARWVYRNALHLRYRDLRTEDERWIAACRYTEAYLRYLRFMKEKRLHAYRQSNVVEFRSRPCAR